VTDRVVVDASALAALAFNEPAGGEVARRLEGAIVFAPALLRFELANVAWKKTRRASEMETRKVVTALATVLEPRWGINWQAIDAVDTVLVAQATGLSVYDASYVWLAGSLGADLVTLDERLAHLVDALVV
jgi:predicted nucleic acid-binding protein